jgi:hypothetical protein
LDAADLQIIHLPIDDLVPYARNSRTHSEEQIEQIAASITEFGFTNPVLIDSEGGIIAGHGRVMAARKLGLLEVPCLELAHLTDAQKRAYVIADNKLALNAGWDEQALKIELEDLKSLGFEVELTGFSLKEIAELGMEDAEREMDPNKYTAKIATPIYEMKGEKPAVDDLFDNSKTGQLAAKIMKTDLPDDVRGFLMAAATRHTVFNYERIAEFYAHADADTQELMEQSALVIIDYQKAVENGYVKLSQKLMSLSGESDYV